MLTIPLSLGLIAISILLVVGHIRAWRTADHGGLAEAEREFQARRYRRRLQSSAMVGVIGVLLLGELWLDKVFQDELPRLLYWSGVGLLLLWLMLLAASDWLAWRQHFRRQIDRLQTDRDTIRGELERLRREHRERATKDNPP
ncbi:hypothetical protein [Anatilimnocola floriformis]|uniref:hypothetical protein n=1 Tax=Anatilimnocola floriformis TaxID=2948575 RepID=UPI0020C536AB|nr:hypothetical protein [Anatilimnocola floriformis]